MPVKAIPDQYRGAVPYLCCKDAEKAMEFYKNAFGATEIMRIGAPGMVGHGEMKIGEAVFMLADEFPQMGFRSPPSIGGTPVHLYVYVEDVDTFSKRAVLAGAKLVKPVQTQFYGDRSCQLEDPFGHIWGFATHVEDVTPEEIQQRAATKFGGG